MDRGENAEVEKAEVVVHVVGDIEWTQTSKLRPITRPKWMSYRGEKKRPYAANSKLTIEFYFK